MRRVWLMVFLMLAFLAFVGWASDFVTLQGERTIYTAQCKSGVWQEGRCTGQMVVGHRYRYRASKKEGQVSVQDVDSVTPGETLSSCVVRDGRNWACPAENDSRSWTVRMENGTPVVAGKLEAYRFRRISKWQWHLLAAKEFKPAR